MKPEVKTTKMRDYEKTLFVLSGWKAIFPSMYMHVLWRSIFRRKKRYLHKELQVSHKNQLYKHHISFLLRLQRMDIHQYLNIVKRLNHEYYICMIRILYRLNRNDSPLEKRIKTFILKPYYFLQISEKSQPVKANLKNVI
jgi:hypothetical protein